MQGLAAALVLTLSPEALTAGEPPAFAQKPAAVEQLELNTQPALRTPLWIPAGAYGLAGVFAGGAGLLADTAGQPEYGHVRRPGVLGMIIGGLVGAIPGAVLGNEARKDPNDRQRVAVSMLDVAATAALLTASLVIFR